MVSGDLFEMTIVRVFEQDVKDQIFAKDQILLIHVVGMDLTCLQDHL